MILFTIDGYAELGKKIAKMAKAKLGELEIKTFPNGERYMRIDSRVRGQDAVIVGGTIDDAATLTIFDLANGLVTEGCRSLKVIIPFFSYSTMERATRTGEVVTAKTRARLLSAIPSAPFGNEIILMDLHAEGIPFYFEGLVKTQHLYAKKLILSEARRLGGKDFVLGAVDAGRAKWVESLANDLGVQAGFIYKKRDSQGNVSVSGINVSVKGRPVIIYDDMIRSGSSMIQACRAYKEQGATFTAVITTHADFTEKAVKALKSCKLIKEIVCTDTHPKAFGVKDKFLKVISTAEIFAAALQEKSHAD